MIKDMDGNELKVGDVVLFATRSGRIARAKIMEINNYGLLKLHTLKNRYSTAHGDCVLLDKNYNN